MRVVTVNWFKWPYRGRARPVTYGERAGAALRVAGGETVSQYRTASCGAPHHDELVNQEKSPASRHAGQLFPIASVIGQH